MEHDRLLESVWTDFKLPLNPSLVWKLKRKGKVKAPRCCWWWWWWCSRWCSCDFLSQTLRRILASESRCEILFGRWGSRRVRGGGRGSRDDILKSIEYQKHHLIMRITSAPKKKKKVPRGSGEISLSWEILSHRLCSETTQRRKKTRAGIWI